MSTLVLGFALIAVVLLVAALASGLIERAPLSYPMIFLGLGFILAYPGQPVAGVVSRRGESASRGSKK
jgi:hypothetical protein